MYAGLTCLCFISVGLKAVGPELRSYKHGVVEKFTDMRSYKQGFVRLMLYAACSMRETCKAVQHLTLNEGLAHSRVGRP